jgi:hypothetical protein
MYGLRKINKNGIHYELQWPLEVGAEVAAPDWNSESEYGGLYLLPDAQGDYVLLDGDYWAVVEFDESTMVRIENLKAKVPRCKIVHLSANTDGLFEFFKDVKFDSQSAFFWAREIGNREHMRKFITESEWAYEWARYIGDREQMRQFITDSEHSYLWAKYIGDHEYMRQFVTDQQWAYYWARDIGDTELMRQFITHPKWAYYWAMNIGDQEYMKQFVVGTETEWEHYFAKEMKDWKYLKQNVSRRQQSKITNKKTWWQKINASIRNLFITSKDR